MKKIPFFIILLGPYLVNAHELKFNVADTYINTLGENSDLVAFCPLFELIFDSIDNKGQNAKISWQKLY